MLTGIGCTILILYALMPNVCLKDSVQINGAHFDPVMVRIIEVARDTAPMLEEGTVWVTSANDSDHLYGSLHFDNRAFDIRIKNIIGHVNYEAWLWAERMQNALGDKYDVLLERDHIHIEYDPTPVPIPAEGYNLRIH